MNIHLYQNAYLYIRSTYSVDVVLASWGQPRPAGIEEFVCPVCLINKRIQLILLCPCGFS